MTFLEILVHSNVSDLDQRQLPCTQVLATSISYRWSLSFLSFVPEVSNISTRKKIRWTEMNLVIFSPLHNEQPWYWLGIPEAEGVKMRQLGFQSVLVCLTERPICFSSMSWGMSVIDNANNRHAWYACPARPLSDGCQWKSFQNTQVEPGKTVLANTLLKRTFN